jgi:hypothetical protein
MTAVALAPKEVSIPAELAREILARIDRGGLHICEPDLRYKLRWDERKHGSLLKLLDELESRGLIESAIHFRLTEQGRALICPPITSRRGATAPGSSGRSHESPRPHDRCLS